MDRFDTSSRRGSGAALRLLATLACLAVAGPATAQSSAGPGASEPIRAGALVIEGPWSRATPAGAKVAAGYLRVRNTGTEPDRLVGASLPLAGRTEVHEMATVDGTMRMRPVEGLSIPPGGSVELKPGGLHLMFMDLSAGLKEGDDVRGTLVFERAGTVTVTFAVGGMGAGGPGGHRAGH